MGVDRSSTGYVPLVGSGEQRVELQIPDDRQEWEFTGSVADAPEWIDKGWAGTYGGQPALHIPMQSVHSNGPYGTRPAVAGDKIIFEPQGPISGRYLVEHAPSDAPGQVQFKPPQMTGATMEALITYGYLSIDDLTAASKAELARNNPRWAKKLGLDDPNAVTQAPSGERYAELYKPIEA